MPLRPPLNDEDCLGPMHDVAEQRMQTKKARTIARMFPHVEDLIRHLRSRPQRDDLGDPDDGPRIACDVSQRLRFFAPDPACFERTHDFLTLALLIDPDLELTSATMMVDNGLHTFPVEIRNGVPRAIVLDPIVMPLRNAMNATAYQLRNASPMDRDQLGPWFADLARNACSARGAEDCYHVAMDALRTSLLTGEPVRDPEAIECVLGLAYDDAPLFGPAGRMAHDRVSRSIRNLSIALDQKRVAGFLNNLMDVVEPMAGDVIKAALIAKFGPAAQIALQGVELGTAEKSGKRRITRERQPTKEDDDQHDEDTTTKQDELARAREERRARVRRMTFAFRNTRNTGTKGD